MKTKKELIESISIIDGNLSHIESTKIINGTLLIEIERVMEQYAQQQVKALSINSVRLTLMLEALDKALIQIKKDVDWSFTDCATWSKRQHEVTAKIELIKELLNNEA